MENPINALLIHPRDNVAVALVPLAPGDVARYRLGEDVEAIEIAEAIPMYHKFARENIAAWEHVRKYGETIGAATRPIPCGAHVHTHSVTSLAFVTGAREEAEGQ